MRKLLLFFAIQFTGLSIWSQTRFESLNFIMSIQGQQIVSGQHNDQKNLDCGASGATGPRYWTDRVFEITGKYPALWGGDFLFHGSEQLRWEMTYEAERQWNSGAIVNIMWHACPPTQGASCQWDGGLLSGLSAQQFAELLTDGSNLNTIWKARVNEIAVHLQYLKEAGVEVFWRPYHEQNQTAFWWNSQGPQNTAALWRMMHNYMTNDLGLDNLVWIWNVQDIGGSTNYWEWNPGNQYWDMLTLDIYADGLSNPHYYNQLVATAGGKPIAIGECFNLPSAQRVDQYSLYTFFMNWAYGLKKWYPPSCANTNSDDFISEVYNNPKVITLDEMPGWGRNRVAQNLATGKIVTVSSTELGNNTASNINDRNYGTRWSSVYANNQWVAVDLNGTFLLDSVKIRWETALASAFQVQVSADGNNWTTIQNVSNNSDLNNLFVFQGNEANHFRINCLTRSTEYGFSIYELEVYGKAKSLPYHGVAINIPGIIQAEDYDLGGQGVAYNDVTPTNTHGAYRTDGVDIEVCTDAGGGYNLAGIEAGEWTQYSINVTETGFYEIKARVAAVSGGRTFHVEVDGENVSGGMAVPNTGGWQTWQTVSSSPVLLTQGLHYLRLVMDSELFNINYLEVTQPIITSSQNINTNTKVVLFPNPTHGFVNYQLSDDFSQENVLEVYALDGQLVYVQQLQQKSGSFSLNFISAGMYLVKISSATKTVTQSIVLLD